MKIVLKMEMDFIFLRCAQWWARIRIMNDNKVEKEGKNTRASILTNIFSSERLASQQFKNIGINKFRIGGHNICRSTEKKKTRYGRIRKFVIWSIRLVVFVVCVLTVNTNGTVVTNSNMKWNERICCQIFPCGIESIKAETINEKKNIFDCVVRRTDAAPAHTMIPYLISKICE